jgi:trk system potassium uptake protein TrkH
MNFKPIFYVNGLLLLALAVSMIFPAMVDLNAQNQDWKVFAVAMLVTAFAGFAFVFTSQEKKFHMSHREIFVMTTLSWILMTTFGALPFCFAEQRLTFTDAFFEAMSGLTTTGSTAYTGLDSMPAGLLLWRALLHWIGGIGFIVVAIAILPLLQISGMQLFKSQSFGEMEKSLPRASQIAGYLCGVYFLLTALCAALFYAAGMTMLEAICHSMATISTGGFSTSDASIGHFASATVDWIAIFFMTISSLPFMLFMRLSPRNFRHFFGDSQARAFVGMVVVFSLMLTAYVFLEGRYGLLDSLRHSFFVVSTIMSTTGFVTQDYGLWGPFAVGLAFFLTFLGACSGSTAGGIKTFRLQILWKLMMQQLNSLISPHSIDNVYYNGKKVSNNDLAAVAGFFFVYIATWIISTILLLLCGLDVVSAMSGSITAITNVGPALGAVIGPAGNFSTLDPAPVWILSISMLLGRLEFMTIIILLMPRFWRGR